MTPGRGAEGQQGKSDSETDGSYSKPDKPGHDSGALGDTTGFVPDI